MIVRPKFVQTKKCNGCGAVLDRSMFTLDKRNTDGLQGKCNACRSKVKKAHYEANLEKMRAEKRKYYESLSPERKKDRLKNKSRNPVKNLIYARKRQTAKMHRTPVWVDHRAIEEIYRDAAEFRAAGLDVHVDHIIPLRAKLASGLHVHQNLTIKLASWNDSKGNKYEL